MRIIMNDERMQLWPTFRYYCSTSLEEVRKTTESLSQYSWCL